MEAGKSARRRGKKKGKKKVKAAPNDILTASVDEEMRVRRLKKYNTEHDLQEPDDEGQVEYSQANGNALNGVLTANVNEEMRMGALKQYNREHNQDQQPDLTSANVEKLVEMIQTAKREGGLESMKIITQTLGDVGQKKSNVEVLRENKAYEELALVRVKTYHENYPSNTLLLNTSAYF